VLYPFAAKTEITVHTKGKMIMSLLTDLVHRHYTPPLRGTLLQPLTYSTRTS